MQLSLEIKECDYLTKEEKLEIDEQIDYIISKHKGNMIEINRLVFDSITALTSSEARTSELAEQGRIKRFWGGLTGKNRKIQSNIDAGFVKAQYKSQQTIQKLAEQNLMSFELITVINNKLNSSIIAIENEINSIYSTMITFFKQTKSELIQLENKVEKLEKNVNLLNWVNSIEYQMYNGVEYSELNKIEKIVCAARDFYNITSGIWKASDLLLLKSAIAEMRLSSKDTIKYMDFIKELSGNEELFVYLFQDNSQEVLTIGTDGMLILDGLIKIKNIDSSEKYIINFMKSNLHNRAKVSDTELKISLTESYIVDKYHLNINSEVNVFDFIVELLLNLKIGDFIVNEKYLNYNFNIDFKNIDKFECNLKIEEVKVYADKGNTDAQFIFSILCMGNENLDEGIKYAKMSADRGNAKGNLALAGLYLETENPSKYKKEILENLELASEQNIIEAQHQLGVFYLGDEILNISPDYKKALYWLTKAAEQGNDEAQYAVGLIYSGDESINIKSDYKKALYWLTKAAEQGNDEAQYIIGDMYYYGNGVDKDYNEAFTWYNKSACQGNAEAQYSLGYMYNNGQGVIKNYNEALVWYKKAAEQGHGAAIKSLGNM